MSTNYYVLNPDREAETSALHIGKASAGWRFLCRAYPELGINSLEDWKRFWREHPEWEITDDYGDLITPQEMMTCIVERQAGKAHTNSMPCTGVMDICDFTEVEFC